MREIFNTREAVANAAATAPTKDPLRDIATKYSGILSGYEFTDDGVKISDRELDETQKMKGGYNA